MLNKTSAQKAKKILCPIQLLDTSKKYLNVKHNSDANVDATASTKFCAGSYATQRHRF